MAGFDLETLEGLGVFNDEIYFNGDVTFFGKVNLDGSQSQSVNINSTQVLTQNINATGIGTFKDLFVDNITIDGKIYDGDGNFGTSGQVLSSDGINTKWVSQAGSGGGSSDPVGTIVAWSGSIASIPNEYQLCDGAAAATTELQAITGSNVPDLRDRFVVGAGNNYAVDATGGSANAVLIAHSHTYNRANQRNVSDGGVLGAEVINNNIQNTSTVGIDNAGNASTTQTGNNANLPPYYALCYIIKHTVAGVNSASVGSNLNESNADQFVTFVENISGNNPVRVDTHLTYNPSTNTMSGINYSGISTFSNIEVNGQLKDGDGNFGSNGQVLSSDGTDTKWIDASGDLSANNPGGGNVNLRLTGATGTNDDVLLTAGNNITVTSISANGFTLNAADTNTTYTYNAVSSGPNVLLRLTDSSGNNDDIAVTAGTGINFSGVSAAGFTVNAEGLKDRTTASASTASIANDVAANISLSIPSVSTLLKLQTSAAAWVTLYYNAASRTADANRSIYADPVAGLGVLAEVVTTGAETIGMSPAPILWNNDSTPADTIYAKVVNRSGSTQAITVTATYLQNEK